jgi:Arc/MetJ-type ribon-helix-helix transcriptional regulator
METVPAKVTEKLVKEMDRLIEEGWYANRSDFIREAVREMIKKSKAEMLEDAMKEDIKWGLYGKD